MLLFHTQKNTSPVVNFLLAYELCLNTSKLEGVPFSCPISRSEMTTLHTYKHTNKQTYTHLESCFTYTKIDGDVLVGCH